MATPQSTGKKPNPWMEHIKHYKTVVNPNWNVKGHKDFKAYKDVLVLCKQTYDKLSKEQKQALTQSKATTK